MKGTVLPASAGMILMKQTLNYGLPCAPRIRGDDPQVLYLGSDGSGCSPHPRG